MDMDYNKTKAWSLSFSENTLLTSERSQQQWDTDKDSRVLRAWGQPRGWTERFRKVKKKKIIRWKDLGAMWLHYRKWVCFHVEVPAWSFPSGLPNYPASIEAIAIPLPCRKWPRVSHCSCRTLSASQLLSEWIFSQVRRLNSLASSLFDLEPSGQTDRSTLRIKHHSCWSKHLHMY